MSKEIKKPYSMLTDYITGNQIPNIGSEENRQNVLKYLVEQKGYKKEDIQNDVDITLIIKQEVYRSKVQSVVNLEGKTIMLIKCAAGSLNSREKEALSAARLLNDSYQIPYTVISDGKTALIFDTISGKQIGEGLDSILSRTQALERLPEFKWIPYPSDRKEKASLIFRTYDSMNVNCCLESCS